MVTTRQQQRHATRLHNKDTAAQYRKSVRNRQADGSEFRIASWRNIERLLEIGSGDAVSRHGQRP